jgi:glucosamine--fructose-6-phosphate aminotransferase (isomerizing)
MSISRMLEESREGPAAVARQNARSHGAIRDFAASLRQNPPAAMLTLARGSSDHAAAFAAYLVMARLGRLVTSLPLSIVTLYQANVDASGLVAAAFSQSGESPDLIESTRFFAGRGATTAAFVNATDSPLARAARWVIPLEAGEERGVAATKSFIAQLAAAAHLVAAWEGSEDLERAIDHLPEALEEALRCDWSAGVEALAGAERMFVIGRGTGLAIALEAALKLKETCALQAEAFSGAELMHGPLALVERGFPMIVFAPRGPAQAGLLTLAGDLRARGARVLLAAPAGTPGCDLPLVPAACIDLDPVCAIQSFYPMAEALARKRGYDPDRPRHLAKVTRTH